jgi:1-phosphofructokinase family hexose kinase
MNEIAEGARTGGRRLLFVAANPSVDRLYEVDQLTAGEIHRPLMHVAVPGGKGLNAARAAATLGGSVTAIGIVAGRTGEWIAERLADLGLDARLTSARGETRTCISILDRSSGALTELYERGDEIELAAWHALEAAIVDELERGDVVAVALSGSLPAGAPTDGFARIARLAGSMPRPIAVLVDTYGPALGSVLAERPTVVKVNAAEAAQAGSIAVTDAASAVRAGESLIAAGAGSVVVTLGAEGAVVGDGTRWTKLALPDLRGPFPVGSGDAFLAGLAVAYGRGEPLVDAARLGMAAAIANAQVPGAGVLDPDSVDGILERVVAASV